MTVTRLTPIIFVENIEPCLPFWTERIEFERTAEVPHEDRLGFVILPSLASHAERSSSTLFIEVDDVQAVAARLDGVEVVRATTDPAPAGRGRAARSRARGCRHVGLPREVSTSRPARARAPSAR